MNNHQQAAYAHWERQRSMARKPTKDERTQTSFMKGYKDASAGRSKANPYSDPSSLFWANYEKGYEAGKPGIKFI